jgi:hypothetical protein
LLANTVVVEQPRDWGTADRYLSRGRITSVAELVAMPSIHPGALVDGGGEHDDAPGVAAV